MNCLHYIHVCYDQNDNFGENHNYIYINVHYKKTQHRGQESPKVLQKCEWYKTTCHHVIIIIIIIPSKYFPISDWLIKVTRIIHHNQLLLTKFGTNFVKLHQWHQTFCHIEPVTSKWRQMCSLLHVIELLTEKTWAQGCVIFGEQKNKEQNGETPLWEIFWMNNKKSNYWIRLLVDMKNSAYLGRRPRLKAEVDW